MSDMANDEGRWHQVLTHLNLLSMKGYTGEIPFVFLKGRVARGTVRRLERLANLYLPIEATPHGGGRHGG